MNNAKLLKLAPIFLHLGIFGFRAFFIAVIMNIFLSILALITLF